LHHACGRGIGETIPNAKTHRIKFSTCCRKAALEILSVTRRLRFDYLHTPDEQYYDLGKRSLQQGLLATMLTLYSRPEPEPDGDRREFEWTEVGCLTEFVPEVVWDKIDEKAGRSLQGRGRAACSSSSLAGAREWQTMMTTPACASCARSRSFRSG
jgi:hypothetical protein